MLWAIVGKSLWHRKGKVLVAALAIVLAASLASAFLNLLLNVQEKWEKELRAYGANIVLLPKADVPGVTSSLAERDIAILGTNPFSSRVVGYAPFLYAVARIDGKSVGLAGTWPDAVKIINPWWKVEGDWLKTRDDAATAMVGTNVANNLKLKPGDDLAVTYGKSFKKYRVTGIVSTGSSEDNQVILSLTAAQRLTNQIGMVSLIQVRAIEGKGSLEGLAREMEQALPGARARTVLQIVEAEKRLLNKIQLLMGLIAVSVLFCSALGVMTTMASSVLERRGEIGLMKALGADSTSIAGLFLAETVIIGVSGGFIGYGIGFLISRIMATRVFDSSIYPEPLALLLTTGLALAVSIGASLVPVRKAAQVDPAIVLRGE